MEIITICSPIKNAEAFNHINSYLTNWDLSPVEGEALHIGANHSKYGHIRIKMYASSDDCSKIIWHLTEKQLPPDSGAKPEVEKILRFFLGYFAGLRNQSIPLTFEIIDGTYHQVDSSHIGYHRATVHALIDCFDHDHIKFNPNRVSRSWEERFW